MIGRLISWVALRSGVICVRPKPSACPFACTHEPRQRLRRNWGAHEFQSHPFYWSRGSKDYYKLPSGMVGVAAEPLAGWLAEGGLHEEFQKTIGNLEHGY